MATELEAVNRMLMVIGQAPVKSVPDSGISDATQARLVLREYTEELQSEGYDFNTNTDIELTPNDNKNVLIPDNVVRIDSARCEPRNVSMRSTDSGRFLYDLKDNTFEFETPVRVDTVFSVSFENLPATLQRYVSIRAARVFANRVVGAQEVNGYTQEDEARAKSKWLIELSQDENLNIFNEGGYLPQTYRPLDVINRSGY